ncbi:MAG TPA: hypothetical protein VFW98_09110 [Gemmatimonadaceae bacterium]|nr:hypothetical protein [Gemmatimonadaceae bacterium]
MSEWTRSGLRGVVRALMFARDPAVRTRLDVLLMGRAIVQLAHRAARLDLDAER